MAEFLGECIESVLRADLRTSVLLVINCSTDNTLQIMHDYARTAGSGSRQHRVLDVMVNHSHDEIHVARERVVQVRSADDWIVPDCLRKMVEFGVDHPNVGVI